MTAVTSPVTQPRQEPWERPEVAALIPAAIAKIKAQGLNAVEKAARGHSMLDCLITGFGRNPNVVFPRNDGETDQEFDARRRAHNDQIWAEYSVLTALDKGSDLTPERADRYHRMVEKDLPRLREYSSAYDLVRSIETENLDLEEPSATQKAIKRRLDEQEQEMSDYLGFALSEEQNAVLKRLHAPGGRYKEPRFRLQWTCGERCVLGVPIRIGPISYRVSIQDALRHCLTQADVRAALACWRVQCRAERRDGDTVLVTQYCEIWPAR